MTLVPLPDIPTIRCRLIYRESTGTELGNRLYFSYTGGPPSAADLASLASAISSAWATSLASLVSSGISLFEVDCLDIASYTGNSGTSTAVHAGSRAGIQAPVQVPFNVQYLISRRYRGGKPKGYFPFGNEGDFATPAQWTSGLVGEVGTQFPEFIAALDALVVGSITITNHISLSYKHLFTNVANSSGREHAVPNYRPVALHDIITGYLPKSGMGSQKRRRASTTP